MGNRVSSLPLTVFEILNELYIALGSGIGGLIVLLHHGITSNQITKNLFVCAVTAGSLLYVCQSSEMTKPSKRKVVFITGCDTGLGFSLAHQALEIGFTVIAGFLNPSSLGALQLIYFEDKIHEIELDITKVDSVKRAVQSIEKFLKDHPKYVLWAVVNNAGVMVFGEFEWQTERLIQHQVGVNLLGTMRMTKHLCPLLRRYKSRVITVSSHCAEAALPGIAVYSATKAALAGWSDGLRVELGKYGVKVITFLPGSFTQHTEIMARQIDNVYEMHSEFSREQLDFYDDYFKRYNSYLGMLAKPKTLEKIDDPELYYKFERALLETHPQFKYKHEPFRYQVYYNLFKVTPVKIRDILVTKFMKMPQYVPRKKIDPPDAIA